MAIVRWDPFRELAAFEDRVNRVFQGLSRGGDNNVMARGAWVPPVDIHHTDRHEIVVRAELPGMKREDIQVIVENNMLTLRGERTVDASVREDQWHRMERSYGEFVRSFTLPSTVDSAKVSAEYRDGTLTVTLPLREEAKPKQIRVEVAA